MSAANGGGRSGKRHDQTRRATLVELRTIRRAGPAGLGRRDRRLAGYRSACTGEMEAFFDDGRRFVDIVTPAVGYHAAMARRYRQAARYR
jgi:hypothetical protein